MVAAPAVEQYVMGHTKVMQWITRPTTTTLACAGNTTPYRIAHGLLYVPWATIAAVAAAAAVGCCRTAVVVRLCVPSLSLQLLQQRACLAAPRVTPAQLLLRSLHPGS